MLARSRSPRAWATLRRQRQADDAVGGAPHRPEVVGREEIEVRSRRVEVSHGGEDRRQIRTDGRAAFGAARHVLLETQPTQVATHHVELHSSPHPRVRARATRGETGGGRCQGPVLREAALDHREVGAMPERHGADPRDPAPPGQGLFRLDRRQELRSIAAEQARRHLIEQASALELLVAGPTRQPLHPRCEVRQLLDPVRRQVEGARLERLRLQPIVVELLGDRGSLLDQRLDALNALLLDRAPGRAARSSQA